jgi:S-formylglutathione hydrolase FrmB
MMRALSGEGAARRRRVVTGAIVLIAGIGVWLVLHGDRLPGRHVGSPRADVVGVRVVRLTLDSAAVGRKLAVSVVVPPGGADGRPLLVFLHERGGSDRSWLRAPVLRALAALGTDAPVVAFPAGSEGSYWHDRAEGDWGRYVTEEVIPRVTRRFRTDGHRVAVGGISMGGFGAYSLALAHRGRFCAAGGHSPALWEEAGVSAAGAFDDADDFARHDVIAAAGRPAAFGSTVLWLDGGTDDPFRRAADAFAARLRAAGTPLARHVSPGGHDSRYWLAHWPEYLRFYARALASCRS